MTTHTPRRTCIREGCSRYISHRRPTFVTCSLACQIIHNEVISAERITAVTGDGEHWALAVTLNDAMTAYIESQSRVYRMSRDAGITDDEWRTIRDGGMIRSA